MKIKTFETDTVNDYDRFDKKVNDFMADKIVIDVKPADCTCEYDFFSHTVTIMYKDGAQHD